MADFPRKHPVIPDRCMLLTIWLRTTRASWQVTSAIHGLTFHNSRFEQAVSLRAFAAITHSAWRSGHPWPDFPQQPLRAGHLAARIRRDHAFRVAERPSVA
jgi:hypothetical protein